MLCGAATMNVSQAVKQYVTQMIKDSGAGMKVLVMDKDTVRSPSTSVATCRSLYSYTFTYEHTDGTKR